MEREDGSERVVARATNEQILARIRIAPIETELRIRRLHMLREMVRQPETAAQCITAVFVKLKGHKESAEMGPQLREGSTPRMHQFSRDILELERELAGCTIATDMGGDFRRLFADGGVRAQFMRADFTILKHAFLTRTASSIMSCDADSCIQEHHEIPA